MNIHPLSRFILSLYTRTQPWPAFEGERTRIASRSLMQGKSAALSENFPGHKTRNAAIGEKRTKYSRSE